MNDYERDALSTDDAGRGLREAVEALLARWPDSYRLFASQELADILAEHPATPAEVEEVVRIAGLDTVSTGNNPSDLAAAVRRAQPPAEVTSAEPGCTCGGMAACEQCQSRDAGDADRLTRLKADIRECINVCQPLGKIPASTLAEAVMTTLRASDWFATITNDTEQQMAHAEPDAGDADGRYDAVADGQTFSGLRCELCGRVRMNGMESRDGVVACQDRETCGGVDRQS